jgi:predicted component of type VI protein secretion system
MNSDGSFGPDSVTAARERYNDLASVARLVVREAARAMDFDREEYRDRVDTEVVATAQDTLFAAELAVSIGTRAEFDAWRKDFDGQVTVAGSDHVDNVVWHDFAGEAVAATFQNEPKAAVSTLRRQAFGQLYRDQLYEEVTDPTDEEVTGE